MTTTDFNAAFDAGEIAWDEHNMLVPAAAGQPLPGQPTDDEPGIEIRLVRTRLILAIGLALCLDELARQ